MCNHDSLVGRDGRVELHCKLHGSCSRAMLRHGTRNFGRQDCLPRFRRKARHCKPQTRCRQMWWASQFQHKPQLLDTRVFHAIAKLRSSTTLVQARFVDLASSRKERFNLLQCYILLVASMHIPAASTKIFIHHCLSTCRQALPTFCEAYIHPSPSFLELDPRCASS